MSRETKTAPIRSNIVRMGHKIEGKKFRPICGQLSKESSLLCTQSKIEAKRPKQRFLAGRAVGCDFPNFWDFTKKFRLREIFWHTFDKFRPFGCRATSKRKKNITWLWGAPRSQPLKIASRNQSQKIFWSKNYKISRGQQFSSYRKEAYSWSKLGGFWPFLTRCAQTPCPRGPEQWSPKVPFWGYQMTPQTLWWAIPDWFCSHWKNHLIKQGQTKTLHLFKKGQIFRQKWGGGIFVYVYRTIWANNPSGGGIIFGDTRPLPWG